VQFDIFGGKITRFDTSKEALAFKSLLEKGEGEIFGIAELGLGVNEFVTEFDGGFEDKKVFGGAHIGIGGNRDLGGKQSSTVHLDIILRKVSLKLDKKWLFEEGKLAQKI
jgi:leucyl aminopeptidase (aminopeptidase T)